MNGVSADDGARGIVEMLFCTSLIALVGAADQPQSSPRKLQIVNTKACSHCHPDSFPLILESQRQSMICELLFPSSILAVKLNRKTLVIVLETEIYIYDISNMRLLHVIETAPNPDGNIEFYLCRLYPSLVQHSNMCTLPERGELVSRIPFTHSITLHICLHADVSP